MYLYPQPTLPFLPRVLLPFLTERKVVVQGKRLPATAFTQWTPATFDAEAIPAITEQIAHMVQKLIVARRHEAQLRDTPMRVPADVQINDLRLTDRAKVSLQGRRFFGATGPWRSASLYDVAQEHAIGARLFLALLVAIEAAQPATTPAAIVCAPQPPPKLEAELEQFVRSCVFSTRSADIYLRITGWDGRGGESLQQVASAYKITTERVRQIYSLAVDSVERQLATAPALPRLREAVQLLTRAAPASFAEAADLLRRRRVSAQAFDPGGVLAAAKSVGVAHDLEWGGKNDSRHLLRARQWSAFERARHAAMRLLRRHGVVTTGMLASELTAQAVGRVMAQRLAALALRTTPGTAALGDEDDWWWQPDSAHAHGVAARLIKLIEYSTGWMPIGELAVALGKPGSNGSAILPEPVLTRLCRELNFYVNAQGSVRCGARRSKERESEQRNDVLMATILREHGGMVPRQRFQRLCLDRGINRFTFAANLRTSPLIALDADGKICRVVGGDHAPA